MRYIVWEQTRQPRLPFLDLYLTGLEGSGDDMSITAFNGPGECVVFR
jgi:hypothetical protein